jgi:hypothetical protein
MSKIVFLPLSVITGLISGLISRRVFRALWGVVDHEQPPKAENRWIGVPKLALALALEGAVSRLVRGLADHGSRRSFAALTGRWPGDEEPDAAK